MSINSLLRGVSAVTLALASFCASARAQETLPTIDVGAGAPSRAPDTIAPGGQGPGDAGTGRGDGGPGGRFTGYAPDLDKPADVLKSNVPVLQAPQNVQFVTRETMDDRQSLNMEDAILNNVSSVNRGYANFDRFYVRGFDLYDTIYRNGLRTPWEASRDPSNIQTIEILKGSSTMVYGRNEVGGLVDFVTKRPLFDQTYYSVQEQTGSWGLTRTTVDATGPVTSDKSVAYRFIGAYDRADSFIDFVTHRNAFIAPSVSWRPTEQFQLHVEAEFRDYVYVNTGDVGIPAIGNGIANIPNSRYLEPPTIAAGLPEHQQKAFGGYDWTYDINKDWSLTNRFAYTYSTQRRNSFAPYAVSDDGIAQLGFYDHIRTLSELATNMDLKGKFDTGPLQHKVLLGVDYLDNEITDAGCDFYSGPAGCGGALANAFSTENIYLPLYSSLRLSNFGPSLVYNDFWKLREYQFGVYGQDQISFADDRLHLLLGGRYDWARYGSVTSSAWSTNDPSFAEVNNNYKFANDGGFSPNVGVVVQPIPWLSFYANYAESFGLSNGTPAPGQPALPPQRGRQWEGGVKAELLDKRLVATFAYYDIHKTNILQQVLGTGYSIPIGEAESKGVEFDLAGRINDNWSAIATYTHDDALITEDQTGNVGHRLQNVPRNQGSLWLKYTAPAELRGLNVGAGLRAVGQRPGDDQNDFWVPAYATVDAFASYKLPLPAQYPKMTIQLNVNNLANARYYEASTYGRLAVYPGSPRTFLVSLRAEY